jgi:uncharacterized membrane protein YgcG
MQLLQRSCRAGVCLLALLLAAAPSLLSQTFPPRPGQRDFILDEASLIHSEDAQQIKTLCERLLSEEKIPIIVVTIPSLAKYDASDIESYARALFDNWGIGSQTHNYGVLLLVSLGDRKARIELGSAWAGAKDDTARMIMDDILIPNFKKSNYSAGIPHCAGSRNHGSRTNRAQAGGLVAAASDFGADRRGCWCGHFTHPQRTPRLGLGPAGSDRSAHR